MAIEIRTLRESDDRSRFRSGDFDLDRFFVRFAGQNQFRLHLGTTHIAVDGAEILGYVTVAAGNLEVDALPAASRRSLPHYPLPVLRVARLATDEAARGRGLGKALLRRAFRIALRMADEVGCVGVVVDAKSDAVGFYTQFGFIPLEVVEGAAESRPQPTSLFLPLALIRGTS